ncbi:transcription factor of the MADS box [Mortierella claussenii]|nr:transcription factor of the MADS box [Mortierella claussenii]
MSAKRNHAQTPDSPTSSTGHNDGHQGGLGNSNDHVDKKFKQIHGDGDEDDDDDDDEDAPKSGKRAGRRKIKIEYIEDKSRRHITFSKRKSGIMKKAYELSTLTGTQVLLLVVSETGLVYTFTTPKLQPLVTKAEGKNLIQACLHAPDKDTTPDATGEPESPEPTAVGSGDYDDNHSSSPQQTPQTQTSPSQPSPQPPHMQQSNYSQQQQQQPEPSQQQQTGGYGSSSAMSVPTYPPPYGHIPFPAAAAYGYPPNMGGVQYQNPSTNAQQPYPGGNGNQYWTGPPPQAQQMSSSTHASAQNTKGGRKGEH